MGEVPAPLREGNREIVAVAIHNLPQVLATGTFGAGTRQHRWCMYDFDCIALSFSFFATTLQIQIRVRTIPGFPNVQGGMEFLDADRQGIVWMWRDSTRN